MADIFDELLSGGVDPRVLAGKLRRQRDYGQMGELSGDAVLAPMGRDMQASAMEQAVGLHNNRDKMALEKERTAREAANNAAQNAFKEQELALRASEGQESRALRLAMAKEAQQGRVDAAKAKADDKAAAAAAKEADEQQRDLAAYGNSALAVDEIISALNEIKNDPALKTSVGRWSAQPDSPFLSLAGTRRVRGLLEKLDAKFVVDNMRTLKEASATGSTGFGQLSNQEGAYLKQYLANLKQNMEYPDFIAAIDAGIRAARMSKTKLWAKANRKELKEFRDGKDGNLMFQTADGEIYNAD